MIGVQYDVFWDLNPKTLSPFIKAFTLKQRYDDSIAWQHGFYIKIAIASALNKNANYPQKPLSTSVEEYQSDEDRQKIIKERFMKHAKQLNVKFRKEHEFE